LVARVLTLPAKRRRPRLGNWIDARPGDVVGAIAILEQRWVDSTDDRPAAVG
jgi:hypothetical protein